MLQILLKVTLSCLDLFNETNSYWIIFFNDY